MKANEKSKKKMPMPKLPRCLAVESKKESEAERKKREEKEMKEYIARAEADAEDALSRAHGLIDEFEMSDGEMEEEDLISELDCIRDDLQDCSEDGWRGFRDAMDELSNRLWLNGVAWPQFLPACCWADIVEPEDVKIKIHSTYVYEEDFQAIRKFSDELQCTFKAAVNPKFHGVAALRIATPSNIFRGLRVLTAGKPVPTAGNAAGSRRACPPRAG